MRIIKKRKENDVGTKKRNLLWWSDEVRKMVMQKTTMMKKLIKIKTTVDCLILGRTD